MPPLSATINRLNLPIIFVFLTALASSGSYAQKPDSKTLKRDRGIEFFQKGDMPNAIINLKEAVEKDSSDAEAWYFLGLAYSTQSNYLMARPVFERLLKFPFKSAEVNSRLSYILILANRVEEATENARQAIGLGEKTATPHYVLAEAHLRRTEYAQAIQEAGLSLQINPEFTPALITKSLSHNLLKQYAESADSLEKFIALAPNHRDADMWRDQILVMKRWSKEGANTSSAGEVTHKMSEVTTRYKVLHKLEPSYTEAARLAGVQGTVILRANFSKDGQVSDLVVLRSLAYGLTHQAIQAARKIKFQPATKDGQPVSMWVQLEYKFNLF